MKMESKRREAFSKVVMALLDAKNLSQRKVALDLDTSPSNFNQRILAGSMRPDMIMEFNRNLGVDLLKLVELYEQGESLNTIIRQAIQSDIKSQHEPSKLSMSLYDMLAEQNGLLVSLQTQIQQLVMQQLEVIELLKAQRN
jgi:hypothetical protein